MIIQKVVREDLSKYNHTMKNTSQILKDQYVWRSGANLPGNIYRVPQDYSVPKKRSRPNTTDLHKSTPELENQVCTV